MRKYAREDFAKKKKLDRFLLMQMSYTRLFKEVTLRITYEQRAYSQVTFFPLRLVV